MDDPIYWIKKGDLDNLKKTYTKTNNRYYCNIAAQYKQLEILKWLRRNGCIMDYSICVIAVNNDDLEMLEWAHQIGCPSWGPAVCQAAAENGNLRILKWLRQNECSWDEWTCYYAARNHHIECFNWAYKNGCPCDQELCGRCLLEIMINPPWFNDE